MTKNTTIKRLAIGAALAGAAGYIAGILTAPKSGKKARKDLSKMAGTSMADIERQLKELHGELGKLLDDAKLQGGDVGGKAQKELKSLLAAARNSKEKMREIISSVHEGEATDIDLKNAMTDARRAIDHIKDFIDK